MPVLWFFYMLLHLDDFNHVKMAKSVRASNLCSYVELCPLEKQFRMFSGCFDSLRKGPGMTLRFPAQGSGPGSCYFQPGLDLDVLEASTSDDSPSMSAMRIPGISLVVNQSTCMVCITYHHRDVLRSPSCNNTLAYTCYVARNYIDMNRHECLRIVLPRVQYR